MLEDTYYLRGSWVWFLCKFFGFFLVFLGAKTETKLLANLSGILNPYQVGKVGTQSRRDHLGNGV